MKTLFVMILGIMLTAEASAKKLVMSCAYNAKENTVAKLKNGMLVWQEKKERVTSIKQQIFAKGKVVDETELESITTDPISEFVKEEKELFKSIIGSENLEKVTTVKQILLSQEKPASVLFNLFDKQGKNLGGGIIFPLAGIRKCYPVFAK